MLQSGTKFELQEHSSHRGDLASWSDEARMDEFVHTGNPEYLTPTLAHRMCLSPELMQEVPGVSPSDIEIAITRQRISDSEYDQLEQDYLSRYGLDNVTLGKIKSESEEAYLSHLMEQVSRTVSSDNSERQDDDRNATEVARTFLIEFITEKPDSVSGLFEGLRLESIEGVRDVQVLREVFLALHTKFIALSNKKGLSITEQAVGKQVALALNHITAGINSVLNDKHISDNANYLAFSYLHNFEIERKFTEPATLDNQELELADALVGLERLADFDRDICIPFEIQDGVMAIFGVDKNVLYVLTDKELSSEVLNTLQKTIPKIKYSVEGQYFARRVVADVPFEIEDTADRVIDAGEQFGRDVYTSFDTKKIRDYLYLLQTNMRETIERDFGFQIKELSIPEQFYFLNYLKHTTVASVETMKLFVGNYGIAALRAFLVGGYDENAAENIMAFGVVTEADTAKPAFEAYAGTLDAAEQFTNNIEKSIASPEVKALLHEVQEGLLKRAGHLFNAGKQMALWEYSEKENIPELISAFKGVARMENILSRIGTDSSLVYTRNHDREGSRNPLYDMGSNTFFFDIQDSVNDEKVQLKIFVRPTANQEGEARINFELYLEDLDDNSELKKAFTQTIISRNKKKTVTRSVIRFGFDLDTTTNPPRFSFDMGRHTFADDTMERTGDVLGNILEQVAPEGHNMTDFDPKFSDPKNFARIAEAFKKYFKTIALEAGQ